MRSRRAGVFALLVLLVAAAVAGRWLGPGSRARFPSSFAAEPEGLLAFRRLLDEMAIPVVQLTRPFDELIEIGPAGVLVVATPLQRGVDLQETQRLRDWLDAGGALLAIDDAGIAEVSHRFADLLDAAGLSRKLPVADLDPTTLLPQRPETGLARGAPLVPAGVDLRRLELHEGAAFLPDAAVVPLAHDDAGEVVAAEHRLGRGRVVRVLGPLLANDRIGEGDHLVFALRLIEDLRGNGPVIFDEYHHGYGGIAPLARNLDAGALLWTVVAGLGAALLYALSRGVRFGPPRAVPEPPRRSSLEFVRSMASLYLRADASTHALESMTHRFEREARRRWNVGRHRSLAELGIAVARRAGVREERVLELLTRAEGGTSRHRPDERELVARARALAQLEQEVFGGD